MQTPHIPSFLFPGQVPDGLDEKEREKCEFSTTSPTPMRELARVLGGAVGATRPACDEGWAAVTLQVGQSGKVVSPKLYIAVALSGAMSHIAGCLGSKVIVAINKDKEANIFSVAHFGIVADYKEVLPALTAKLKELKSA